MPFVSLKGAICRILARAIDAKSGHRVTFLTPAGLVSGICASEVDQISCAGIDESYKELLAGARAILEKDLQESASQTPDDGYILLKDVEIRPIGSLSGEKRERLILFVSQMTGLALDP